MSERHTSELPVVIRRTAYWTEEPDTLNDETVLETTVEQTPVELSFSQQYGLPLLFVLATLALLGLLVSSYLERLQLTEHEQELCMLYDERKKFDEWISKGDVPGIGQYNSVVKMSSLAGLVDLAIDTNNRVIEDGDAYYVIRGSEDVAYVYAPKISRLHDWLYNSSTEFGGVSASPESLWPTISDGDEQVSGDPVEFGDFREAMKDADGLDVGETTQEESGSDADEKGQL